MGDALIVRRGGSGDTVGTLRTVIIDKTTTWVVPKAKDQTFHIRLFGAGGGGGTFAISKGSGGGGSGGGGGYMNNTIIALLPGDQIPITIAVGNSMTGGTTSFGTYLAANGGLSPGIGSSSAQDSVTGGSGGGGSSVLRSNGALYITYAGIGTQFGGGGGYRGNRGGKWGGGGGTCDTGVSVSLGGYLKFDSSNYTNIVSGLAGNGGNDILEAEDGTNTINNDEVPNGSHSKFGFDINLQGAGKGKGLRGGGGGYGGNGGNNGGGGGGYGGNGGNGVFDDTKQYYGGGGGGGYGADGGEGGYGANFSLSGGVYKYTYMGFGGGGYGKGGKGGNGQMDHGVGERGGIAAGGGGGEGGVGNGGNGICIIQYFE